MNKQKISLSFAELKNELFQDQEFYNAYLEEKRNEELKEFFAQIKTKAGLKSKDIAAKLNKSPSTINRLENNLNNAVFSNLSSYAKACGVKLKLVAEVI